MPTGMRVGAALGDLQIGPIQFGFHERRTNRRDPKVVCLGLLHATAKYLHAPCFGRLWPAWDIPGVKNDLATRAVSANLLNNVSNRRWEVCRHRCASQPKVGSSSP